MLQFCWQITSDFPAFIKSLSLVPVADRVSVHLSAHVGFPGIRRGGIVYSLAFIFF